MRLKTPAEQSHVGDTARDSEWAGQAMHVEDPADVAYVLNPQSVQLRDATVEENLPGSHG